METRISQGIKEKIKQFQEESEHQIQIEKNKRKEEVRKTKEKYKNRLKEVRILLECVERSRV